MDIDTTDNKSVRGFGFFFTIDDVALIGRRKSNGGRLTTESHHSLKLKMSCNTRSTGNTTRRQGTAEVGTIMADAPLTPSDDQQDQPLWQLQEGNGNGNGNDGDSRTRSRFDDTATAGEDDDGSSFGSGGTGSEAAEEDGGFTAGTNLDVGRMTLAGGDQQPPTTVTTETSAALAAKTLTGTATAAAGKIKIEADAEAGDDEDDVEAPPAVISETGTATITRGSKVVLRQGKHNLQMPVEILAGICKFLPFGKRAAGVTRSIAGVILDGLDSDNEKKAFWKALMIRNFSALEIAYAFCYQKRTRERGMDLLGEWEKHNKETVAEYFKVSAAEVLKSTYSPIAGNGRINHVRFFRCPREAIIMDHPALLLRAIRQGHLDVFGDSPYVRNDDGRIICDYSIGNLITLAMTIGSPKCLSALLDLAADAARPALTDPDGWPCLHRVIMRFLRNTILCPLLVQLQLAEVVLHHEVCDINVLCSVGYTALHLALNELWRLGPNDSLDRISRCLVTIAMLVKAGADINRECGDDGDEITPQEMAIEMAESNDQAVAARGVLALEMLNGRLLVNEDISGIIAKYNALAGVLSFL